MSPERLRRAIVWIAITGLAVNAISWSLHIIDRSRFPDGYAARHWRGPWIYPTQGVILAVAAIAVEALVPAWLLARRPTARRAFYAAAIDAVVFFGLLPLAMHAPTPFGGHLV